MIAAHTTTDWVLTQATKAAQLYARTAPAVARTYDLWHWISVAWERIVSRIDQGKIRPPSDRARAVRVGIGACVDELRVMTRYRLAVRYGVAFWQFPEGAGSKTVDSPVAGSKALDFAAPEPVPSDQERLQSLWYDTRESRRQARLSWKERVRLYLWLVEGWTMAEIAAVWDVHESAICQCLTHARKVLR